MKRTTKSLKEISRKVKLKEKVLTTILLMSTLQGLSLIIKLTVLEGITSQMEMYGKETSSMERKTEWE